MFRLYSEQLRKHLDKKLSTVYLLFGNDIFLLKESANLICQSALSKGFKESYKFQIEENINWQTIFYLCKSVNLFTSRQIIQIFLPEKNYNKIIDKQLEILISLLHEDLLLILQGNNLTKIQENTIWFSKLVNYSSVLVSCQTPEKDNLLNWVFNRAKQNNLYLEDKACQLLCYYYEGNLAALNQALERLSLIWSDGKLTLSRVKDTINGAARFTPFNWIDALLMAKSKRALRILQQLRLEDTEPIVLLRILRNELLLLVTLKRQLIHISLNELFNKYFIWQNRRLIINRALNRLSYDRLRIAIRILTRIEIAIKEGFNQFIWLEIENLSLFIC